MLDLILLGMGLEGALLTLLFRTRGQGVSPGALWPNLLSGMCLVLAMRAGLAGAWWGWVSLPLLGALAFHVADLRRLWRRASAPVSRRTRPG